MTRKDKPEAKVTTIRATCPTCGEVELTPDDIELRVCTHAPASYYQFVCPLCTEEIQKPADDLGDQRHISGTVAATVSGLSEEVGYAHEDPSSTTDAPLDFARFLVLRDQYEDIHRVSTRLRA